MRHSTYKFIVFGALYTVLSQQMQAQSPVPVTAEPRHKTVFENSKFRVIEAIVEGGDTTLFHTHQTPSVFVVLDDIQYRNQVWGKEWTDMKFKKGDSWFSSFTTGPATHRAASLPNKRVHVLDIEILARPDSVVQNQAGPVGAATVFSNDLAAAFQFHLSNDLPTLKLSLKSPALLIQISGEDIFISNSGTQVETKLKPGKFLYLEPTISYNIKNGMKDSSLQLIALK